MDTQSKTKRPLTDAEWEIIRQHIETLRYGSVTIQVQDGRVVQIDKVEKYRL